MIKIRKLRYSRKEGRLVLFPPNYSSIPVTITYNTIWDMYNFSINYRPDCSIRINNTHCTKINPPQQNRGEQVPTKAPAQTMVQTRADGAPLDPVRVEADVTPATPSTNPPPGKSAPHSSAAADPQIRYLFELNRKELMGRHISGQIGFGMDFILIDYG